MRNIILAAAAASALLLSLVPLNVRAQGPNANGLTGPTQSTSDSSLTLADLQNRRQQIVVASMNFSNDEQKSKFLEVYVLYQIRLKQIMEGKRTIVEDYTKSPQNGVISSADANRLLKRALALDDHRQDALAKYLRDLKPLTASGNKMLGMVHDALSLEKWNLRNAVPKHEWLGFDHEQRINS